MTRPIPPDLGKIAGLAIASGVALMAFSGDFAMETVVVEAGELRGGVRFFSRPPQLVDSITTFNAVSIPAAKYYFTIALPEQAGEPLDRVVFQQQPNPDPINFYPEQTFAFFGDRHNRGQEIALESVNWDKTAGKITVTFAQAIAPGTIITIGLKPWKNPDVPGVYQFRVFALPPGTNSQAMDLGVARFQFYRGGTW
ncbi:MULTISPECIES: DUF2808 domain-containing protein [unclassified Synechocystis]|uniref:DUF2808 domain-containing protein n=1 Tax=unclassified Synechocystis TaxID=2640012 RepID=UPI00041E065C|nr:MULTISPECIES: DUF2808 domain-containing protein [unclassified Synechocystis]AIE74525.1 hypothetical protein D082_19970 [Synechocystis sp. PCC 6714]MCT0254718.1 DUF2808 domain-containing protein [Synechocystis sp. CS-94]